MSAAADKEAVGVVSRFEAPVGSASDDTTKQATTGSKRRAKRTRITLQLPEELVDELRDAVYWLSGPPHQLTLTAFAEQAFARELDRIKQIHNHGEPFRQRTGPLKPGRPIGS